MCRPLSITSPPLPSPGLAPRSSPRLFPFSSPSLHHHCYSMPALLLPELQHSFLAAVRPLYVLPVLSTAYLFDALQAIIKLCSRPVYHS